MIVYERVNDIFGILCRYICVCMLSMCAIIGSKHSY
jgi:hypothetical protein